jgi:hypothetical protein
MKLSSLDACLKAEAGKDDEAIDQCLSWQNFMPILSEEPTIMTYLIRMVVTRYQIAALNRIMSSRKYDDEILLKVLKTLDSDEWQRGMIKSLDFERAMIYSFHTRNSFLGEEAEGHGLSLYSGKFLVWLLRPLFRTDLRYSMNLFDKADKACRMPYHEFFQIRESYEKSIREIPRFYLLSSLVTLMDENALLRRATIEAKTLAARAGIACKIYQKKTGQFPEQLSQLVPDILPEVPIDPFSGKELIYRRTPSGFIVYSVGSNGKDDGGRETMEIQRTATEKDDDWAWYEGKK